MFSVVSVASSVGTRALFEHSGKAFRTLADLVAQRMGDLPYIVAPKAVPVKQRLEPEATVKLLEQLVACTEGYSDLSYGQSHLHSASNSFTVPPPPPTPSFIGIYEQHAIRLSGEYLRQAPARDGRVASDADPCYSSIGHSIWTIQDEGSSARALQMTNNDLRSTSHGQPQSFQATRSHSDRPHQLDFEFIPYSDDEDADFETPEGEVNTWSSLLEDNDNVKSFFESDDSDEDLPPPPPVRSRQPPHPSTLPKPRFLQLPPHPRDRRPDPKTFPLPRFLNWRNPAEAPLSIEERMLQDPAVAEGIHELAKLMADFVITPSRKVVPLPEEIDRDFVDEATGQSDDDDEILTTWGRSMDSGTDSSCLCTPESVNLPLAPTKEDDEIRRWNGIIIVEED